MTVEEMRAGDYEMPFGKHNGKALWLILDEDPDYFEWMLKNANDGEFFLGTRGMIKLYGNSESTQDTLEKRMNP